MTFLLYMVYVFNLFTSCSVTASLTTFSDSINAMVMCHSSVLMGAHRESWSGTVHFKRNLWCLCVSQEKYWVSIL